MPRILAIDYGTKRVGLAVTDSLQIIATGLTTVHSNEVIAFLKSYTAKEEVETFVLGMPTNLDNSPTDATPHVIGFERKLKKEFPNIPIHLVDERYTSKMAHAAMLQGGLKKKARQKKETVDMVAATIILQSFMSGNE